MLLQIEDYFFKKEKESIRILHISDSLKINVYLLQAAQCVFSFSPKRGNFIFKQGLRLLVGCYFHMNVDFGIFLPGEKMGESTGKAQTQPGDPHLPGSRREFCAEIKVDELTWDCVGVV